MSNISFSAPFTRSFIHSDYTATSLATIILPAAQVPEKRVVVIVQNKSTTEFIQVILNPTDSVGITIPPLGNISLDNYNGPVAVVCGFEATVHLAYATV